MYITLLTLHSLFRWLVLLALIYSIYRSYKGYFGNQVFTRQDNHFRHWTATMAHIQFMIGVVLYFQSPIVKAFRMNLGSGANDISLTFFGVIHVCLMLAGIFVLTLGSIKAKRKETDREKFKTMLIWFSLALLIILLAIPWPFSPLAARPLFRI